MLATLPPSLGGEGRGTGRGKEVCSELTFMGVATILGCWEEVVMNILQVADRVTTSFVFPSGMYPGYHTIFWYAHSDMPIHTIFGMKIILPFLL